MARLFGREYDRKELLGRVGAISQVCGISLMEIQGGRAEGVKIARCWTGSGLEFDVNASRGMSIGAFRFRGMPLSWTSAAGDVAPSHFEPRGGGLDRIYSGGLMHNGGLRQVGAPCTDEGEELGLHGRISAIPADQVALESRWMGNDYIVSVSGKVREVSALGENLVLHRKVESRMGSSEVLIEDVVENEGPTSSPFMILYHTNFGFPLIDDGSRLVIRSASVLDAMDGSNVAPSDYAAFGGPKASPGSRIFFHTPQSDGGTACYLLVNDVLPLGLRVRYESANLPMLIQWVNLESRRYVVEVGPSNCKCFGRKAERDAGTLQFIDPGERKTFRIWLDVLSDSKSLLDAERSIEGAPTG